MLPSDSQLYKTEVCTEMRISASKGMKRAVSNLELNHLIFGLEIFITSCKSGVYNWLSGVVHLRPV
jgi:hypothetical protein